MTKSRLGLALLASASLLPLAAAPAEAANILEAGIAANGALVAGPVDGKLATVIAGAASRALPAISPDGTSIAFVQGSDPHLALADIAVVSRQGRELSRTQIEPVRAGTAYAGMRYVEALRWVAPTRLLVRGSINPAQSQYYVIDTSSGRIVNDFTDDDTAAAISPDGEHVATVAQDPHYSPAATRAPAIMLDDRAIAKLPAGSSVESALRFSPDGASIAWATRDASRNAALEIWGAGGVRALPISALPDATLEVYWNGMQATARAASRGGTQLWSAAAGAKAAERTEQDPLAAAAALHQHLVSQARSAGISQPDFWCADCALSLLPRGSE